MIWFRLWFFALTKGGIWRQPIIAINTLRLTIYIAFCFAIGGRLR